MNHVELFYGKVEEAISVMLHIEVLMMQLLWVIGEFGA